MSKENIDKLKEKINKSKQNEFDELYEKYRKEVEIWSGGLVETNRADFLKQYAFYSSVINPILTKTFNNLYRAIK